ncbi:MAG: hypothetical protein R3286_10615 [Gammaproteobacteria bacterium]|nr:hypothetical protein [Gammaproteobacteria bacterium]
MSLRSGRSATPRWPAAQLFLSAEELAALAERCRDGFVAGCRELAIDEDLTALLTSLYLPLAAWLMRRRASESAALVVGVSGAQGAGKSTLSSLLAMVLRAAFGARVATLSIDDIYETRARRAELARTVHPLFATRGVPGTHEVSLGLDVIRRLRRQGPGESTALPVFDKSVDDRVDRSRWPRVSGAVDVVLFEGWCVGAVPEDEAALERPINALERDEDPDGRWRRTVNRHLAGDYRELFAQLDVLIMLRVEGMERVFEWRRLQEHKLAARAAAAGTDVAGARIMSDAEVERFIMHYERITRHILAEMPARADIVLEVDDSHSAASVRINVPIDAL